MPGADDIRKGQAPPGLERAEFGRRLSAPCSISCDTCGSPAVCRHFEGGNGLEWLRGCGSSRLGKGTLRGLRLTGLTTLLAALATRTVATHG